MNRSLLRAALAALALCGPAAAEPILPLERSGTPVPSLEARVLDRYLRGDLLGVLALTRGAEGRSLFYRGVFLADLGLLSGASQALNQAADSLPAGDGAGDLAVGKALSLLPLDPALAPPLSATGKRGVRGRAALDVGGYLLEKGDLGGALKTLAEGGNQGPEDRALATAVTAQALAAGGRPAEALSVLDAFRAPQTSPASDLVYLLRGYHHLERKELSAASDSFLAIPADSLYAPEAKHGIAWVQILSSNVPGAVVRLEEILSSFPGSAAAHQAALDLALAYRDLGMYDQAGNLLNREMRALTEGREWLESLNQGDLASGRDVSLLVDDALSGSRPKGEAWRRSPTFARAFALTSSSDPQVLHLTALQRGVNRLGTAAEGLRRQFSDARSRVEAQRAWLAGLDGSIDAWEAKATGIQRRLPSLREDYLGALREHPLKELASQESLLLLERIYRGRDRIASLTSAQEKARGFTSVIRELSGAELPLGEQKQLRKIRQEAFDGIIKTQENVRSLDERLRSMEGRIWLGVKLSAAERETDTGRRSTGVEGSVTTTIAAAERARALSKERVKEVEALAREIQGQEAGLGASFSSRLESLASRLAAARTTRLLALAKERARAIRDQEARVLYTAADIESSRMEDRLRSLQEGLK